MRVTMALFICAGFVGMGLHYTGNSEFQREMDPALDGWSLFMKVDDRQGAAGAGAGGDDSDGIARPAVYLSTSGAARHRLQQNRLRKKSGA